MHHSLILRFSILSDPYASRYVVYDHDTDEVFARTHTAAYARAHLALARGIAAHPAPPPPHDAPARSDLPFLELTTPLC